MVVGLGVFCGCGDGLILKIKYFEWDRSKNKSNIKKHGVSFQEAESIFYDEYALTADDDDHSHDEDRFIIVGESKRPRLLLACYCYRGEDIIRIISARKATKTEIDCYKENR